VNLTQLSVLFDHLPEEMKDHLGDREFQTCWYGSAGSDLGLIAAVKDWKSPVQKRNNGAVRQAGEIGVFFFTDPQYDDPHSYIPHLRRDPLMDSASWRMSKFESAHGHFTVNLAKAHSAFSKDTYVFFISTTDEIFEETIINLGYRIDVGCHMWTMSGPGPRFLGNIGCSYYLGNCSPEVVVKEHKNLYRPSEIIPFNSVNLGVSEKWVWDNSECRGAEWWRITPAIE
jgi:hypothetical protein